MSRIKKSLFLISLFTVVTATIINVPNDQPTIQAGIDAAVDGDTVLVETGTYVENITIAAKDVRLISMGGPAVTIIVASDTGSVIQMINMENTNGAIRGFTITGGHSLSGGGILIQHSSPTIQNNIITNNRAGDCSGIGGGIAVLDSSNPIIVDNSIYNNHALGVCDCICYFGGGIFIDSTSNPVIGGHVGQGNYIYNNSGDYGHQIYREDNDSIINTRYNYFGGECPPDSHDIYPLSRFDVRDCENTLISESYFPMKIGDQRIYYSGRDTLTEAITDTLMAEGKLYYRFSQFRGEKRPRIGREGERIYTFYDRIDYIMYDFSALPGDFWLAYTPGGEPAYMLLISDQDTVYTEAGRFDNCYHFYHDIADHLGYDEWFAPGIGLVQRDIVTFYQGTERWSLGYSNLDIENQAGVGIPYSYSLHQNFPNPFNPVTTIRYELPRFSHVRLSIYDILGREVAILGDREEGPGVSEIKWNASTVPSGIYFIQMLAGDFRQVRKVMVLK